MSTPSHSGHFNPACFLAAHGVYERGEMPPCDGRLIRAHLIPKQQLRLHAKDAELWARGAWVLACGGACGNGGHHGMFDVARTLRLPRAAIPQATEELAAQLGLSWWLDRTYGSRELAA